MTEFHLEDVTLIDATTFSEPLSKMFYYIVPGKCTECIGFHEEPQCAAICPVDSCVQDPNNIEKEEILLLRKAWLHQEV